MRSLTYIKYSVYSLILVGFPTLAGATASIGDAAKNVLTPTEILTKLVLVACYIIGTGFIFAALAQYRIHRQSPKLVPLTTPILLLILGIVCVLIPYSTKLFGESFSAVEQAKKEGRHMNENVLPLPDVTKKGPMLPVPSRSVPQDEPTPESQQPEQGSDTVAPQDTPTDSTGGGHWTSDPRYNQ